jgi:hypothetical protein
VATLCATSRCTPAPTTRPNRFPDLNWRGARFRLPIFAPLSA